MYVLYIIIYMYICMCMCVCVGAEQVRVVQDHLPVSRCRCLRRDWTRGSCWNFQWRQSQAAAPRMAVQN